MLQITKETKRNTATVVQSPLTTPSLLSASCIWKFSGSNVWNT